MNRRNFIVESISGIAAVGMVGNLQGHQKIDKNGVLQKIWPAVKIDGHVEEVLSSIREMKA